MRVINLASGSDGNITYIESESTKLIVDMGLSCSDVVSRLELIKVDPKDINAIIISHEHSDHIKGVDVFSNRYSIPVYAHENVWNGLDKKLKKVDSKNRKIFYDIFYINDIEIIPVEVPHDVPCFGFSFKNNNKKISILTDLGHTTNRILDSVRGSQLIYLEANYDRKMLAEGTKYPLALKRRISGPNGHLSNDDCAEFIKELTLSGTRQIVLSHLSEENNEPELAYEYICSKIAQYGIVEGTHIRIDVASRNPGVLFRIN
ncbi:MAG: MBL fold metallo-hydrolase [Clostridia bacterium]|nr:MBL fold metallo-hydrolase [Clostridia bacterium]